MLTICDLTDLQDFESSGHDVRHVVLQAVHDGVFQEGFVQILLLLRRNATMRRLKAPEKARDASSSKHHFLKSNKIKCLLFWFYTCEML